MANRLYLFTWCCFSAETTNACQNSFMARTSIQRTNSLIRSKHTHIGSSLSISISQVHSDWRKSTHQPLTTGRLTLPSQPQLPQKTEFVKLYFDFYFYLSLTCLLEVMSNKLETLENQLVHR